MAILQIPINPALPSFTQETALDGRTYRLTFRWSEREGAWYLTMETSEGALILGGLKMTAGAPLLRFSVDRATRPLGELILVDPTGEHDTPGRNALGTETALVYLDASEASPAATGTVIQLGSFIVHAEMRQKTAAATAFAATGAWGKIAGVFESGILDGFTLDDGRLIYTGAETRTFLLVANFGISTSIVAGATVTTGLSKGGTDPTAEQAQDLVLADNTDAKVGGLNQLVSLKTNEYLELWGSSDATGDVTWDKAIVTVIG